EHKIDLLGRRGIRAGAAARQEIREPDRELLRPARIQPEQTQRVIVAVIGRLVALRLRKSLVQHQNFSPRSMRYSPLGSTMATRRMMQPSPRSQFQGKNAKVQRRPVTASRSPPTFSIPRMPLVNSFRCTG